jgi:hypothetical protein
MTGAVWFYSTLPQVDRAAVLKRMLDWAVAIDRTMDKAPIGVYRIMPDASCLLKGARLDEYESSKVVIDCSTRSVREISALVDDRSVLTVDLSVTPCSDRLCTAIEKGIPPSVRGEFCPGDLFLRIGAHPIIDVDNGMPRVRDVAWASACLFGYDCPHNWMEMRRVVPMLSPIAVATEDLASIIGEAKLWLSWYC